MAANSRVASAVQILCVMAYVGPGGTNSARVASSLRTNPVVVRRLLKDLQRAGLVAIRQGRDGGVRLARPPAEITLDQVCQAVETDHGVFALRPGGNPDCPVNARISGLLGPIFDQVRSAVTATLGRTTLASLVQDIGPDPRVHQSAIASDR